MLLPHEEYPNARIIIGTDPNKGGPIIKGIADGIRAPVFLSGIPQSSDFFNKVREVIKSDRQVCIGLHTLNRHFEQQFVGLAATLKESGNITQFQYSTTDFTAPRQIDLVRGVHNLCMRDRMERGADVVHCKAGKGRSATLACCYLLNVFLNAPKFTEDGSPYQGTISDATVIDLIIRYAQTCRNVVKINSNQRPALVTFYETLKAAGSFNALYESCEAEIKQRNAEFVKQ